MKMVAAVLVETGRPLVVTDLEIPQLKPGQVLVDIAFSGVCRTQLLECRGYRGEDRYLPHSLGHEGSGVVSETGPGVAKVKMGDRVILSWIKSTGADVPGTTYRWGSRCVNAGGITTFSRQAVVSENRLTLLENDVPLREAAMLGCAVPTGLGAVLNTARPRAGESLAVLGVGGIGLCAVAAAALAGCTPVVAVDIRESMLQVARQMGATHCVLSENGNVRDELLRICPGGLDYAIEATGRPEVMGDALASVRCQGGAAVIVGNAHHGERMQVDPKEFNLGKRLLGTWGGDNAPDRDFPRYARLLKTAKLDLQPMMARIYSLCDINDALDDLEAGTAIRPLVDMAL
jgi:S-(hydroxymethyl)glutathione dehydrogenase/alcohol dehydrogenase